MPAVDSLWLEWYETRQLDPWMYQPLAQLEYDLLVLAVISKPDITYAELWDIDKGRVSKRVNELA